MSAESAPETIPPEESKDTDGTAATASTTATATSAAAAAATGSSTEKKKKKKKKGKKPATDSTAASSPATAANHQHDDNNDDDDDDNAIDVTTPAAAALASQPASSNPSSAASASSAASSASAPDTDMLTLLQQQIASLTARQQNPQQKSYKFWSTQPVPQLTEQPTEHGPIETKRVSDVSATPYPLPAGFEWCNVMMSDEKEGGEVYKLLNENYVEDDDNMFRFDYSLPFLRWALEPPHWSNDFHIGVRMTSNRKLVAFISGIPQRMRVYDRAVNMYEINFLCIHKKLRSKRLAPVLIKEITRRVNRTDVWQAVYTAGVVLPKPVASCRYWHRSLQVKKLIDVKFTKLARNMTLLRTIKLFKTTDTPTCSGIRPMEAKDVKAVHKLLSGYLGGYQLVPLLTEDEVAHWLLPRNDVIYSYVCYGDTASKGKLTDFVSFYNLPSTIIGHPQHHTLKAAYSYYNVATHHSLVDVMNDALHFAYREGFDVFNALDVMENAKFLEKLKFGPGDGHLQYYVYNWRCPEMKPEQIGLVLL